MDEDDLPDEAAVAIGSLGFDTLHVDAERYDNIFLVHDGVKYMVMEGEDCIYLEEVER